MISRKKMLGLLAGAPLLGTVGWPALRSSSGKQVLSEDPPAFYERNFFEEVGVETLINAAGTYTTLGGSLMLPEAVQAIAYTAKRYARLNEVQDKVGERIAEMLKCEAAMVTAGAASALTLGSAAAVTLGDKEKIEEIPISSDPRPEIIIQKSHHYEYEYSATLTGARMVEVVGPKGMEKAINKNTVMALFFNAAKKSSISRKEFIAIGKRNNVPTFNDAAADVPPEKHLYEYTQMGFDMVTYSGGKMLRAPQSTGLLVGRKDLIEAARLNFDPHEAIGRGMKVNKEEMFAMYAAVKSYVERDHKQEWQEWIARTKTIASLVETVPGVQAEMIVDPGPANAFPGLDVTWDQSQINSSPRDIQHALRKGSPSIEVLVEKRDGTNVLHIAVVTLRPDHVGIVGRRVGEVLAAAG